MAERVPISEEQLEALRTAAAQKGQTRVAGVIPIDASFVKTAAPDSYNGNPVLKPPPWTWQVPLYFFVGGVAGVSSLIAFVAHLVTHDGVTRAASWVGFAGGLISAPLLIADLGRPSRFLYMLRVFKPRSAMSLGAWVLTAFSSAAALTVICHELNFTAYGNSFFHGVEWLAQAIAALFGLALASYTSVLVSVTAIPVWYQNRHLVPAVFLTGALGSAAAMLELFGYTLRPAQAIGIVASAVETTIAIIIEVRGRYVDGPLREGAVGWLVRAGAFLSGPLPLLIRIVWAHNIELRYVAAFSFAIGALITRYAWIGAGRVSSRDPKALFQSQQKSSDSLRQPERTNQQTKTLEFKERPQ